MNAPLLEAFDKLEKQRESILKSVSEMSAAKYHYRPPNKWSVGQILTHLVVSEQLALGYMKKKSLGIDTAANSGTLDFLKVQVFILSQRIPLKYTAPEILIINAPNEFSFEELVKQWSQTRSELKIFAQSIGVKNIKKKIFKHLWFGRFNIIQGLTFFYEHIQHHRPQIKRLL